MTYASADMQNVIINRMFGSSFFEEALLFSASIELLSLITGGILLLSTIRVDFYLI